MLITVSLLTLTGMVARFSLGENLGVQTQGGFVVATYIKSHQVACLSLLLVAIASKDATEPWFHDFNSNLKARRKEEIQLSQDDAQARCLKQSTVVWPFRPLEILGYVVGLFSVRHG